MVRERAAERLADLAFNMADQNVINPEMCIKNSKRAVYLAFLQHRAPWTHLL